MRGVIEASGDNMAWTKPLYPRGKVDKAGDTLIAPLVSSDERDQALEIMNNWRSSHSYPLQALKMALRNRAVGISDGTVVAQRLKRLSSVTVKLGRNDNMKLSQMQDIGGCRAVMPTIGDVDELVRKYGISVAKNPHKRSEFIKKYDYIDKPKTDGYRSVHLIYKYRSPVLDCQAWNGHRIEIQIRTKLQHVWATAVETVSVFTGQALKANVGTAEWKRFFALMASAIARRERRPIVPGTPSTAADSKAELRALAAKLNVKKVLGAWQTAISIAASGDHKKAHAFLLFLDTKAYTLSITSFEYKELPKASVEYLKLETENQLYPERQTVLVAADSIDALKTAYPNYYLDTTEFLDAVHRATRK